MPTRVKIKIDDNAELRSQLDAVYENKTPSQLAQWAIGLAQHILKLVNYNYESCGVLQDGFATYEKWQRGESSIYYVRQVGFTIHKMARECPDLPLQAAFRVAGHAVSAGHMKEHAMVASDYAIMVINLMFPDDREAVTRERQWQLESLKHTSGV